MREHDLEIEMDDAIYIAKPRFHVNVLHMYNYIVRRFNTPSLESIF